MKPRERVRLILPFALVAVLPLALAPFPPSGGGPSRAHRRAVDHRSDGLDRFKAYNDAHGHQAGDRLLKEAAAAWREQLRAGDLLARWGGEEFAVALPGASAEDLVPVLERLRNATPSGQTASVGVAPFAPGATLAVLVEQADQALYRAKSNGRDCLELVAGSV